MTHLERLTRQVFVTFTSGELDIIQGLLTGEINAIRDDANRVKYLQTLESMKRRIIEKNGD